VAPHLAHTCGKAKVPPPTEGAPCCASFFSICAQGLKQRCRKNGMAVVAVGERREIEPDPMRSGSAPVNPSPRGFGPTVRSRCSERKWPILMTVVLVVSGMAFMLWWPVLFQHRHGWDTGGDLWGIFRAAHYIGWGFLGGVYDPSTGVNSPPGLELLLAPVAMLSGHLGLTESFPPFFVPYPSAALLLQPIELLLTSTVLFAVDALAERLGVARGRRIALCVVTAVLAWPTVALWGHAEDCLALALAIYALIAGVNGKWKSCGWLFGFALVTQPLVVMMLPLVVAASPSGQRVWTAVRSIALTAVLVGVAFASNAADAYRALVLQPTPPSINHSTPWVSLAPSVSNVAPQAVNQASFTYRGGKFMSGRPTPAHFHAVAVVSGGSGRAIEAVLALLVGLYVWRRPQPPDRFIWFAAACLGMRCMFEAVMLPYYLAPPLILALAITSRQGGRRFWPAVVLGFEVTVFAYHHLSPWAWWLPVVAGTVAILALGYPNGKPDRFNPPPDSESADVSRIPGPDPQESDSVLVCSR
jgi:hypothetical protein